MKYTIFWSKSAVRDLQRVRHFLKNISPNSANNVATQINQYTQKLAMFPLVGKPVEMLGKRQISCILQKENNMI
jgi:plasmid stabilization system protein ParE